MTPWSLEPAHPLRVFILAIGAFPVPRYPALLQPTSDQIATIIAKKSFQVRLMEITPTKAITIWNPRRLHCTGKGLIEPAARLPRQRAGGEILLVGIEGDVTYGDFPAGQLRLSMAPFCLPGFRLPFTCVRDASGTRQGRTCTHTLSRDVKQYQRSNAELVVPRGPTAALQAQADMIFEAGAGAVAAVDGHPDASATALVQAAERQVRAHS